MIAGLAKSIFGSANDRYVRGLGKYVDAVNGFEPNISALSDDELRTQTDRFRQRLAAGSRNVAADEYNRLSGPIKREIGNLKGSLDQSLTSAADTVGEGANYGRGMREYSQAASLNKFRDVLLKALTQKALPY